MKTNEYTLSRLIVVAFILVLTGAGNAFATGSTTTQEPQIQSVPAGETVKKLRGIVVKREPDSFRMSEARYAVRIPVVAESVSGAEIGWPFDQSELQNWLSQFI